MLLRLSRILFWLASAVAVLALLAPGGRETLMMAIVLVASMLSFVLWRSALRTELRSHSALAGVPETLPLDGAALREAGGMLLRRVGAAATFEAALHAAAGVLRSELGARGVAVHGVLEISETHASLCGLVEARPGFMTVPQRVRLDADALGRALRARREASDPPRACAVPVLRGEQVVAVLELTDLGVASEPLALAGLLALAREALSSHPAATERPVVERLASGPATRVPARPTRVLVVRDIRPDLDAAALLLEQLGCSTVRVSGMLEGLHALCRAQFDLVLIDLQMSGMSGAEGLNWLRRNPGGSYNFVSRADTPVLALSDSDRPDDAARIRELGFDDHLSKPLCRSRMSAMLSKHLPLRTAEHGAASEQGGAAPVPTPTLDPVALARLTELDPTGANHLVERVLQAFQTSAARLWPQAEAARVAGDRAALRLVAHTLKSSSASIGALQLSQLCARVESAIRLDAPENLDPMLDEMSAALEATLQAIAQILKARS